MDQMKTGLPKLGGLDSRTIEEIGTSRRATWIGKVDLQQESATDDRPVSELLLACAKANIADGEYNRAEVYDSVAAEVQLALNS